MRAQLLTAFGSAENFLLTDVPVPIPNPGEVRVRIAAIGINGLETKIRNGDLRQHFPITLPAILGKEFAGTIDRVGDGVSAFALGDRVAGFASSGVYADQAIARVEAIAHLPDTLAFNRAATLPVAVETATRSIDMLGVAPGWTVVVNGATGGVGTAAVQLLRMRHAHVIGTTSRPNVEYLHALGATPVTYGENVEARIRAAAPQGVDAVVDLAGHRFVRIAIALTGDPQRVVSTADFAAASLGIKLSIGSANPLAASFASILPLAADGTFRTEIARTFTLPDIRSAHALVETGHVRGKVVVIVNEEKTS